MQKKKFLNDNSDILSLLLATAPYLGMGMISSALGFQFANLIPPSAKLFFHIFFWILFVMMVLLAEEPTWNLLLFFAFTIGAGVELSWLCAGIFRWRSVILFTVIFNISAAGGKFYQGSTRKVSGVLIASTLIFTLGYIILQVFQLPDLVRITWMIFGLVLYTLVIVMVLGVGKYQARQEHSISLSIQLYLALFNLCWLSSSL